MTTKLTHAQAVEEIRKAKINFFDGMLPEYNMEQCLASVFDVLSRVSEEAPQESVEEVARWLYITGIEMARPEHFDVLPPVFQQEYRKVARAVLARFGKGGEVNEPAHGPSYAALEAENARLRETLVSKHGGEPLALLSELDEARERLATLEAAIEEARAPTCRLAARVNQPVRRESRQGRRLGSGKVNT